MFVPVVTKDMQLFPGNRQPLPQRIKNVRSRAQSLEDNMHHSLANGTASTTASNAAIAARSQKKPKNQRNAQSFGSLPTSASLAVVPSAARSPPKLSSSASMRKPLDPIHEGVPLSSSSAKPLTKKKRESSNNAQENITVTDNKENPCSSAATTPSSNKSTPDLQELKIRPTSSLSTASAPGLDKTGSSPPTASSSSGGKGIVKWITNTLKGKNSSSKDVNKIKESSDKPGLTDEMDNEKPWRSIGSPGEESKNS